MDKMEATVPLALPEPPAHKEFKGLPVLMEAMGRQAPKAPKGQQVQTEMTAHKGHRETLRTGWK
jgi:hypothetical protein